LDVYSAAEVIYALHVTSSTASGQGPSEKGGKEERRARSELFNLLGKGPQIRSQPLGEESPDVAIYGVFWQPISFQGGGVVTSELSKSEGRNLEGCPDPQIRRNRAARAKAG